MTSNDKKILQKISHELTHIIAYQEHGLSKLNANQLDREFTEALFKKNLERAHHIRKALDLILPKSEELENF